MCLFAEFADILRKQKPGFFQPKETSLLFLVGGIYAEKSNPALLSYAERLDASFVRKAVLVTSSVSISQRNQKALRALLVKKGIDVVDEITCTGGFLFIKFSHPNKSDIRTITEAAKGYIGEIYI